MAVDIGELEAFVGPYYEKRDAMHDLSHVRRILKKARVLSRGRSVDEETLTCAAYFHGIIYREEGEVRRFLRSQGLREGRIDKIVKVAWESQKDSRPETIEGKNLARRPPNRGRENIFSRKIPDHGGSEGADIGGDHRVHRKKHHRKV